jgi:glycolate oxidase
VNDRDAVTFATQDDLVAVLRHGGTVTTETSGVRADRSGWAPDGAPRALVRVAHVDEVVAVVTWAAENGVPVITRGAGTGLAGGASAGEGAVVLDLSALNRIVRIDLENQLAVVEPGVITADLDRAAAAFGLRYAPDPGSVEISTIGGNIATNAGGLRGAKYGVTRDAVLELDVVLADGSRLSTGRRTIKTASGYDLTSLFVGSEGTLAIIVGATLRLQPIPARTGTLSAFFDSVAAAADAVALLTRAGIQPSVLELVDGNTLAAIDAAEGTDFRSRGAAYLLLQTDGFGADIELDLAVRTLTPVALAIERAVDDHEVETLTRARRRALPSIEALGPVLIEDISVPRSELGAAIARIGEISERSGVRIFVFGHAADGNLHPIVLVGDDRDAANAAAERIFALALELGGSLSAEHGIGALKRGWIRAELGERSHDLQRQLKALLDPAGILNPGKAI